ncbi:putative bifunctional diguanylate cyclase/phosphodiesterase [Actinoplanes sp. NPDC049681]|uniref:putative bifunctional diguanylate cyclase/phosphodiesterase n=1 Tax=Actinoplanes sp. NPDC049681 TaxID=3363905 RepID=UPI0037BCC8B8
MAGRTTSRAAVFVLLAGWCAVVAFLVQLIVFGDHVNVFVTGAVNFFSQFLPAVACCLAAAGARGRRSEAFLVAGGVMAYSIGNLLLSVLTANDAYVPFPSISDAAYLLFYPAVMAALLIGMAREHRRIRASVAWDTAVGALGAGTLLAVVLRPAIEQVGGNPLQIAVAVAYPLGDAVLIAGLLGIACLHGGRLPRRWLPLMAGLALFSVGDIVYSLRVSSGGYQLHTPLDAIWSFGVALVSTWAVLQAQRPARARESETGNSAALIVPALANVAALGVLLAASAGMMSRLAVVLAIVTGLAAAGRTHVAYRQLRRMAELIRQARTDDLTGLANRRALYDLATERLRRSSAATSALLLIDLDRFKGVNDGLGHHVGDRLLVQAGQRLAERLRPDDVLARLGGDEFAVIADVADAEAATELARRLRAALATPFDLEGIAVRIDASIGIALHPEHGDDIHLLLRRADVAMYRAKTTRQGQCLAAPVAEGDDGGDQLRLLQELHEALAEDQLVLHYQPKMDLRDGTVRGVEALVRWNHPTRGLLYPDAFLAAATDAGLMDRLTETVLRLALDQAYRWREAGHALTVAVNLSAHSLQDTTLPVRVATQLRERGLPGSAVQIEITEDALMGDRTHATAILSRLRALGVQIAIDDFGTGFSSLAYLRDLPVDELKLDRSFVAPVSTDRHAAALVASTIHLSHSLGLRMVAEGVEDDTTLGHLRREGCDQAQGYGICRPATAEALIEWLQDAPHAEVTSASMP